MKGYLARSSCVSLHDPRDELCVYISGKEKKEETKTEIGLVDVSWAS